MPARSAPRLLTLCAVVTLATALAPARSAAQSGNAFLIRFDVVPRATEDVIVSVRGRGTQVVTTCNVPRFETVCGLLAPAGLDDVEVAYGSHRMTGTIALHHDMLATVDREAFYFQPESGHRPFVAHASGAEFGVAGNLVIPMSSRYGDLIRLWGYHFDVLEEFALTGLLRVNGWFVIGGRVGYVTGGAGNANDDRAWLAMRATEFGGVVGAEYEAGRDGFFGRIGAHLEGGVALLDAYLRGRDDTSVSARLAAVAIFGFGGTPSGPRFSARVGYQYLPYGGAGMGSGDPAFGGVVVGLALDGVP